MAEEKAKKVNNASKYISKDVIVIAVVLIAIAAYIIAECYSATHVDIQTVTAVKSTVYQTLDKKALVIRDEHTVEGNSSGVTVACVNDGEKVKVGGNIAMVFSNSDNAKSYSSALDLQSRLDYYINLESKSAGTATDVEQIDSDVINDVNDYIRSSSSNNFSAVQSAALDLNDKLTRRQMIIGEDIDFSTVKQGLEQKLNAINLESCKPTGYVSTKESGIFSSYSDGCETAFDYKNIDGGRLLVQAGTLVATAVTDEEGKAAFSLDSKAPTGDYKAFLNGEVRYNALARFNPERAEELFAKSEETAKERYEYLNKLITLYGGEN